MEKLENMKRLFDIILSIILILVFVPLIIVISIIIYISSGRPVIFTQKRIGRYGKDFNILKFRTMVNNAQFTGTGLDSYEDDPRVTNFGRILRASSLDELPQLLNILTGKMSFVGPRPPISNSPFVYDDYPDRIKERFLVRPGVTGLAQINGRNELSWEEKWEFDIEYIRKKNLILDCHIIVVTIIKVLKNEGSFDLKRNQK